jgi:hypothetical protein
MISLNKENKENKENFIGQGISIKFSQNNDKNLKEI